MTARAPLLGALAASLLASAAPGAAQSHGEAGADVLALAPAPRAGAMAGAYAAGAPGDPFAVFFNPAGIAGAPGPAGGAGRARWSAAAAYRRHVGDASAGSAALRLRGFGGASVVSVRYLDFGEVQEIVPDPAFGGERGLPTGARVGGAELALGAAHGLEIGPAVIGVGFDMVRSDIADLQDVALAASVGARVTGWDGRIALGAAVQHLGADAGPGRDAPLPRTYRAGGALQLGGPGGIWIRLAADAVGPWDRLRPVAGAEVLVAGSEGVELRARAGWDGTLEDGDALGEVAFGGGLRAGALVLDYAYRGVGVLGDAHQFGLRFRP
ncbi:MAG: hypothetical protein ABFS34_00940 [Gemmatimonadota bacterium]